MIETVVFAVVALLALASAAVVVGHPDAIASTMSMAVTLLSLALLFALLGAPLIAALQILVSAAVVALFLVAVLMLGIGHTPDEPHRHPVRRWAAVAGAAFFAGLLAMLLWRAHGGVEAAAITVPTSWFPILGGALFAIGLLGALVRRDGITVLLSIELMLNAVDLIVLGYSRLLDDHTGRLIVVLVLVVAAAEAAVGVALLAAVDRHRRTTDLDRMDLLRW